MLDLYAGTGAIGIEALSRSAAHCDFVESDKMCVQIIRHNAQAAKVDNRSTMYPQKTLGCLTRLAKNNAPYNLIYADPPFESGEYSDLERAIAEHELLAPEGLLIMEHASRQDLSNDERHLELVRQTRYGDTTLTFFSLPAQ